MRKITLDELREMAQAAKGYIDKIYVHWSAGRYHQFFDDYHINVDADGSIYASTEDLTELLAHTWHRNSRAVGICMAGCYGAEAHSGYNTDFGDYPPTQDQIDGVAKVVAVLCEEWICLLIMLMLKPTVRQLKKMTMVHQQLVNDGICGIYWMHRLRTN